MTVQNTYAAPTDKQIALAEMLSRKAGFRALHAARTAFRGNKVQDMKREEYSRFIDWLKEKVEAAKAQ